VPSQVLTEPDGRIAVSFMNGSGAEAPLVVKGKSGAQTGGAAVPRTPGKAKSWESPFEGATEQERLSERAHEDREIVYFLQQPETHAFRLYHDYTESRPGADQYFNVVRTRRGPGLPTGDGSGQDYDNAVRTFGTPPPAVS
jgi:hypothetical protein